MSEHMIANHPLDGADIVTEVFVNLGIEADPERVRHVAENQAAGITEKSPVENCAKTVANLLSVHIAQLNAQRQDQNKGHLYSNPIELIRGESERKQHKKINHTGNIAEAHKRLKELDGKIVSEETPSSMRKWIFWCTLIGIAVLILAIFSVKTNGAVNFVTWIIDSKWFLILFMFLVIGLSLYYRFVSAGVLAIGGFLLLAWIVIKLPGLTSFILNGVLFLIAAILLGISVFYIVNIVKYKPLPEDEHIANQALIAERDALRKELNEYSDLMREKLSVMKKKFMDNEAPFSNELSQCFTFKGDNGKPASHVSFSSGEIYGFFDFLDKYYRKMRR